MMNPPPAPSLPFPTEANYWDWDEEYTHFTPADATRHILVNRYKTKLCRNCLQTGFCPYEERCMFAHGAHELRTPAMNIRDGLTSENAIRAFRRHCHRAMSTAVPMRRMMMHRAMRFAPPFAFPAHPPLYDYAVEPFAYAHDPYAQDLLGPARLYSRSPCAVCRGTIVSAEPCGYGYDMPYDGCPAETIPKEFEGFEGSVCSSSVGSDAGEGRNPSVSTYAAAKSSRGAKSVTGAVDAVG